LNVYSNDFVDTYNDGMPDSWELVHGLNSSINDADNDNDNDSLINLQEFYYNTNPLNSDTDNDGLFDGYELTDPLLFDTDFDG